MRSILRAMALILALLFLNGCTAAQLAQVEQFRQTLNDLQAQQEAAREPDAPEPTTAPEPAAAAEPAPATTPAAAADAPEPTDAPEPMGTEAPAAMEAPEATKAPPAPTPSASPKPAQDTALEEFAALSKAPRASHNEGAAAQYLYAWAIKKGLSAKKDADNNVIIEKAATKGYESAPLTILQAHMDMVAAKTETSAHDFTKDPIELTYQSDGKLLKAKDTTLGADDGAGVALALYALQSEELLHGPLRVIFTTNEEDGMTGAAALDAKHLEGKYLINLDGETFGSACNSAAGSYAYTFSADAPLVKAAGTAAYTLEISGLRGGHSGLNIHLGGANAIRSLAGFVWEARQRFDSLRLASFAGGTARNAIPAAATATVALNASDAMAFEAMMKAQWSDFTARYGVVETNAKFTCKKAATLPEQVAYDPVALDFLELILACPNGVHSMSAAFAGLVESSSSMGLARLDGEGAYLDVYMRSAAESPARELEAVFTVLSARFGFTLENPVRSPGWAVGENPLVAIAQKAYADLTGEALTIEPVHAGLECGYFAQKNPALSMLCIGPTITGAHTPEETLEVDTVGKTAALLTAMLAAIAAER